MPAPLVGAAAVLAARLVAKQFVKSSGKKVLSKAGTVARKRTIKNSSTTTTGKVKAAQKLNKLNAKGKGIPIINATTAVKRTSDGKRVGKVKVVVQATNPSKTKGSPEIIRTSGRNRDISKGKTKYIQNDGNVFPKSRTQKSNVRRETTGRK